MRWRSGLMDLWICVLDLGVGKSRHASGVSADLGTSGGDGPGGEGKRGEAMERGVRACCVGDEGPRRAPNVTRSQLNRTRGGGGGGHKVN